MLTASQNPFRTERIHALDYQLAGESWDQLLARLAALGHRAAITGPHGHGKSTCLHALGSRLENLGFRTRSLFLNEEYPRFTPGFLEAFGKELTPNDILLFDGSEQLGGWAWRRFLRAARVAKGLIITCHRPGRLPTLYSCRTSPELLVTLLHQLEAEHALPPGVSPAVLFERHQGNFRDVFFALYDLLAGWPEQSRL
jgi:hypothetical protein